MPGSNTNSFQLLTEGSADCTVYITVPPKYFHQFKIPFLLQLYAFLYFARRFLLVPFSKKINFQWQDILILTGTWGQEGKESGLPECHLQAGKWNWGWMASVLSIVQQVIGKPRHLNQWKASSSLSFYTSHLLSKIWRMFEFFRQNIME